MEQVIYNRVWIIPPYNQFKKHICYYIILHIALISILIDIYSFDPETLQSYIVLVKKQKGISLSLSVKEA